MMIGMGAVGVFPAVVAGGVQALLRREAAMVTVIYLATVALGLPRGVS